MSPSRRSISLSRLSLVMLLLFVLLRCEAANQKTPGRPLVFTHVTVVDTSSGISRSDMTVQINGTRISAVEQSRDASIPRRATVIDGKGKFLIPGLWDMHVHTADAETFFPLFLANGVTGIRDMGMDLEKLKQWRREVEEGTRLGPRMVFSGPILDGPHTVVPDVARIVDTPVDGRRAVDDLKEQSVDFVKVYNFLPRNTYFAIADESEKVGLPFAGHVPLSISAVEASDAGQKSIEHLTGILLACSTREAALHREIWETIELSKYSPLVVNRMLFSAPPVELADTYSAEKASQLFGRFVRNSTWQVPTLVVLRAIAYGNEQRFAARVKMEYMRADIKASWSQARFGNRTPIEDRNVRQLFRMEQGVVGAMHRAGVKLLTGTDTPNPYVVPGFSLHEELVLLVEAGMTPMQALRTATYNPAQFLGLLDSLGAIKAGKEATLVLLDSDPIKDIHNVEKIDCIVLSGRLISKPELTKMLEDEKRAAVQ